MLWSAYRGPSRIGPIGWGILGAFIFLFISVVAFVVRSYSPALGLALYSANALFVLALFAGVLNAHALIMKSGAFFLTIPAITLIFTLTIFIVIFLFERFLGVSLTWQSLIGVIVPVK